MGLDELTDAITLQAEILELRANPHRDADGVVIESKLDNGRGPVATVLIKRGTLKRGDIVVAGAQWGKVRALVDERGQQLADAGPSLPVEVLGLDGAPDPGEALVVVDSEARAREITEYRIRTKRQIAGNAGVAARISLDQLLSRLKDGAIETRELPIVLKADVQGSVEAISMSLDKISTEEVPAASFTARSAEFPNPMSCWPNRRARQSSRSTSAPTNRRATWPSVKAWKSATIR